MQINTFFISGEVIDYKRIHEKVAKISLKYEIGGKEKTSCITEFTYFKPNEFVIGQEILIHGEIKQRLSQNKTTGKAFSITDLIAKDISSYKEDNVSKPKESIEVEQEDGIPF